jgi:hypothetical protein
MPFQDLLHLAPRVLVGRSARTVGFPVAQACPDRATPIGSRWSATLAERPGPGRRGLLASGASPASRRHGFPARRGPGRAALAAGGRIRIVGPEALPAGGIANPNISRHHWRWGRIVTSVPISDADEAARPYSRAYRTAVWCARLNYLALLVWCWIAFVVRPSAIVIVLLSIAGLLLAGTTLVLMRRSGALVEPNWQFFRDVFWLHRQ